MMHRSLAGLLGGLFTLCFLFSCAPSKIVYSDHLTAEALAEEVREELSDTDFRITSSEWLNDYVDFPEGLTDHEICFSADGNNLNEFGIWHVPSDQVASVETTLRAYLANSLLQNRSFYDSYIPAETPKLADAEVRVFGNYVCYAILKKSDREIFFHTIEESLKMSHS